MEFIAWLEKFVGIDDKETIAAVWDFVARAAEGTAITPKHADLEEGKSDDLESTSPGSWIESTHDQDRLNGVVLTLDSFTLAVTRRLREMPLK